ncbi:MAG: lamin tail domain-containing protein [Myxococcota bacterium]
MDRIKLTGAFLAATMIGLPGCFSEPMMTSPLTTAGEESGGRSGNDDGDEGPTGGLMDESAGEDDTTGAELDGSTGSPADDTDTGGTAADDTTAGDGSTESDGGSTDDDGSTTGEVALSVGELVPGDLVITEVQYNPTCSGDFCEWFEIYNATDSAVNLLDLFVQDNDYNGGNEGRVTVDVIMQPGTYAVLAKGVDTWPYEFEATAVYGPNPGFDNGNLDRVVILDDDNNILDETPLFFGGDQGRAWAFMGDDINDVANDDSDQWCYSAESLPGPTSAEFGSPFAANVDCVVE